jgi:two-component system sensor histidine kinase KdpD
LLEAVASLAAIALERVHFVEVAQSSQLEAQSERLRSSLLSAISHDIRTPLTALYGLADSLAGAAPALPESERETARAIRDQAMHLHGMVTNLLDMARLQAGKVPLRLEWQPIEEVIGASIRAVGLTLRGNPVRVELAPDLPLVAIDAVLMERVLCNLLENAAKFSPPGAEITIAAATEQHWLALSVSDRGSGFPPGSLPRVFDLFERGAAESPVAGVGLGLAISRAIVEAHAGSIDASNRDGGGACVRIRLPTGGAPDIEPEAGDGPEAGQA